MYNKVPMWCRRLSRQPSLCLQAKGATRERKVVFFLFTRALFLSCRYGISYTFFRARAERETLSVSHEKEKHLELNNKTKRRREVRISPLYSAHSLCFNVAVCLLHAATIMRASVNARIINLIYTCRLKGKKELNSLILQTEVLM